MKLARSIKSETILGYIASIIDLSEETGMTDELFEKRIKQIEALADFYSITPEQAVLFSHFISQGEDDQINTNHIGFTV